MNATAICAVIKENVVDLRTTKMSKEKIERILATYRPVEDMPGYVWVVYGSSYVKIETLREAYEEYFQERIKYEKH